LGGEKICPKEIASTVLHPSVPESAFIVDGGMSQL
jgi:hypothetical protein